MIRTALRANIWNYLPRKAASVLTLFTSTAVLLFGSEVGFAFQASTPLKFAVSADLSFVAICVSDDEEGLTDFRLRLFDVPTKKRRDVAKYLFGYYSSCDAIHYPYTTSRLNDFLANGSLVDVGSLPVSGLPSFIAADPIQRVIVLADLHGDNRDVASGLVPAVEAFSFEGKKMWNVSIKRFVSSSQFEKLGSTMDDGHRIWLVGAWYDGDGQAFLVVQEFGHPLPSTKNDHRDVPLNRCFGIDLRTGAVRVATESDLIRALATLPSAERSLAITGCESVMNSAAIREMLTTIRLNSVDVHERLGAGCLLATVGGYARSEMDSSGATSPNQYTKKTSMCAGSYAREWTNMWMPQCLLKSQRYFW
jgi:hypothetical protein